MAPVVPFIPLIAAGVGAGGAAYAAHKASSGAQAAADTQAEYGKQALALQEKMYQQTRGDLAPWMTAGQRANSTLSYAMGLGAIPFVEPGAGGATKAVPDYSRPRGTNEIVGYAVPRGTTSGPTGLAAAIRTSVADLAGAVPGAATQTASGYVTMRAPDGTTQSVPSQYVNHYTQRGAVQV